MRGWIRLDRKIMEHWLWSEKPFTRGQAWIDLLLLANHDDKKIIISGQPIEVKRGEKITSIRILSERWGWARSKTSRFLSLLESNNMINQKKAANGTAITIENYGLYQDARNANEPATGHSRDADVTLTDTNNNNNNNNNVKQKRYTRARAIPAGFSSYEEYEEHIRSLRE